MTDNKIPAPTLKPPMAAQPGGPKPPTSPAPVPMPSVPPAPPTAKAASMPPAAPFPAAAPITPPPSSIGKSSIPNPTVARPPMPPKQPLPGNAPPRPMNMGAPVTMGAPMPPKPMSQPSPMVAQPGVPKPPVPPAPPIAKAASMSPAAPFPAAAPMGGAPLPKAPSSLPPTPINAPQVKPAEFKKSPLRFLPIILAVLLIVGLGAFVAQKFLGLGNSSTPVVTAPAPANSNGNTTNPIPAAQVTTLTYWGLWEPSEVLQEIFADYQKSHPNIKIDYQMQSYKDIRERLQTAIASGRGPDLFRFHASWTPMLKNELAPMPSSVYSASDFQNTFYPVATQQLSLNNQIYGVPLEYDGLALYYNDDALRAANISAPKTWADLQKAATKLTIRSGSKIQRAGLAIGNATNVEHFSDIIGLLILQNGGDPTNPTSQAVLDAMTFYTNFYKKDNVWDSTFASSTTAFARGDVAMMFAPSWRVHDIKALNPNLKFTIAPVPQLSDTKVTWASYWAEGVSSQSKHQAESWELIKYLSSPDVLRKFYSAASRLRAFGEIYSRKDMASSLASDPYANPYLSDALNAKGWYMSSFTHDNALNDQIIKYYQDAVTAIDADATVPTAMATVQQGTNQVLRQYGITTNSTTP